MWNLVLWPGFERGPPALGIWGPRHWTTREVPLLVLLLCKWSLVSPVEDPPCPHGRAHSHPQPQLSTQVKRVPFVHCMLSHSVVSNSATPWTVAHQAHGILQARLLEWVAISSSRESSRLRDLTLLPWQVDSFPLSHLGTLPVFVCRSQVRKQVCSALEHTPTPWTSPSLWMDIMIGWPGSDASYCSQDREWVPRKEAIQ